jgi:hypothetical protein
MNDHPLQTGQAAMAPFTSRIASRRFADEHSSIGLTAMLLIPAYFFLGPLYSSQYVPVRPFPGG